MSRPPGRADHDGDTSYIAVVDKDRNMVSFEPSLHSGFGTGVVMADLGFIFNCRGDYYSLVPGEANALEPGKRPRSTLQSTLVMKDGQPVHDHSAARAATIRSCGRCRRSSTCRLRHERPAGDRSAALVHAQLPGVAFSAHDVPGRSLRRVAHTGRGAEGAQAKGHKLTVAGPWSLGANAAHCRGRRRPAC